MAFLAQRSMIELSFTMLTLGVISALAMILGAVGLYGVLAYVVAERTREIGVRIAVALASTRLLDALLYEIDALDPLVFVTMSIMLIGIGMLTSYVPARRASNVDATEPLRND